MIVAIERTKFTYLYKYDQIRVDINQLIDKSIDSLKEMLVNDTSGLANLFNQALPIFEQDHEIILLELDKSRVLFQGEILILFDSIQCIYPLTKTGLQLLEGKINDDFIIAPPVFENAIKVLRLKRSMTVRKATALKLLNHYNLEAILSKPNLSLIESSVEKNLLDKNNPQVFNTFLDNLVSFNRTPSYIPDGNIEFICKIGAITIKYLGKAEEVFTNGPFYKSSIKYKSQINSPSYLASYHEFNSIKDVELNSSLDKMVEIISKDYPDVDIFKVSYFFLAFKSYLNKHDNNIALLNNEIEALIANDKQIASFVLALLGYTFSMESIYEGLHKISCAPLLKSSRKNPLTVSENNEKITAEDAKLKVQVKRAVEQEEFKFNDVDQASKSQIELDDVIAVNSSEISADSSIISLVENVSEPIVVFEHMGNSVELDGHINKQEVCFDIKSEDSSSESPENEIGKGLPSVADFRAFLAKEQSKPKQKIWFQILDNLFPGTDVEITFEKLYDRLDSLPEVKDKLFRTNKEKLAIRSFFDAYK